MPSYTLILPPSSAGAIVSDTFPTGVGEGVQWFDSSTGAVFTYYGGYWVQTGSGTAAPEVTTGTILTLIGDGDLISEEYLPTPSLPTSSQLLTILGDGSKISPAYLPDVSSGSSLSIPGATYDIPATAAFRYLRRSHTAAMSVTVKAYASGTFAYPADCVIPVRNTSATYYLQILAGLGVTLNFAAGRNVVGPLEDALLRRVGSTDVWDIC